MTSVEEYDILELHQDWRILRGWRYRQPLYYVAQAAIWFGYLYLTLRFLLVLFAPSWPWQIWTMLLVEVVFLRKSH